MILTKKQTVAIDYLEDQTTNEILFGGGAGGAKSVLGCYWHLKRRMKYPGTRGVIGRWKRKNLTETTLKSFWEVCKMQGIKPNVHYRYNSQSGVIIYANGSETLLKDLFTYPSDPDFDSLGSLEITDAFIDEANQVSSKAKDILKSRIRYKLDENGLIPKILYTCNPAKNWVYTDFYKLHKQNTLEENKAFIQALATDNPYISKHYIENLLTLKDNNSRERLLFGNWEYDDDPAQLIDYEAIVNLWNNDHIQRTGEKYITADIARFGRDCTVIMVWDGFVLIEIQKLDKSSIPESIALINQLRVKHGIGVSNVVIDEDGVGGGVKDGIRGSKGFVNGAKPIKPAKNKNYQNLKTQCYYKLSEYVNDALMYCETDVAQDEIMQELECVKMHEMDKDNKLKILPKDKVKELIGRSPDYSDNFAMRMYFELKPKSSYSSTN